MAQRSKGANSTKIEDIGLQLVVRLKCLAVSVLRLASLLVVGSSMASREGIIELNNKIA